MQICGRPEKSDWKAGRGVVEPNTVIWGVVALLVICRKGCTESRGDKKRVVKSRKFSQMIGPLLNLAKIDKTPFFEEQISVQCLISLGDFAQVRPRLYYFTKLAPTRRPHFPRNLGMPGLALLPSQEVVMQPPKTLSKAAVGPNHTVLSDNNILKDIFSLLSPRDLSKVLLVSKSFCAAARSPLIWKTLCLRCWPSTQFVTIIDHYDYFKLQASISPPLSPPKPTPTARRKRSRARSFMLEHHPRMSALKFSKLRMHRPKRHKTSPRQLKVSGSPSRRAKGREDIPHVIDQEGRKAKNKRISGDFDNSTSLIDIPPNDAPSGLWSEDRFMICERDGSQTQRFQTLTAGTERASAARVLNND
ncbi:hypothetical protein AAMO2058_001500900 [Amorphochlora amoebiformis]|eukprot:294232-Amorphochlora_amoeboformis.AAC.2